jgi:hypothetical protein
MRPHIPPPLDPDDFEIEVADAIDACTLADGRGHGCMTMRERTAVPGDIEIASSSVWLCYAVGAALRGHLPRTTCFIVPVKSGGVAFDLGRGEVATPMVFGGATCRPEPWGRQCDEADPLVLPEHEALAPRRRPRVEEVGDVVFEDWDGLRAPLFGGKAGTA